MVTDELWFYKDITATGYPEDVPAWLSVWLLIITDNIEDREKVDGKDIRYVPLWKWLLMTADHV